MSMSFGGSEFSGETSYDSTFTTPSGHNGVTFLASTGDSGATRRLSRLLAARRRCRRHPSNHRFREQLRQ